MLLTKPNLVSYLIVGTLAGLVFATCIAVFIGGILFISDWIGRERMFSHLFVSFVAGGAMMGLLVWFHDRQIDTKLSSLERETE